MAHDKDTREIFAIVEPLLKNASMAQEVALGQAFTKLVAYVKLERMGALGWMYGDACASLDEDVDVRELEVDQIIDAALKALCPEEVFIDLANSSRQQEGKEGKKLDPTQAQVLGLKEVMTLVDNLRKSGQI